jgi:hypothetical protein
VIGVVKPTAEELSGEWNVRDISLVVELIGFGGELFKDANDD